MGRAGVELVKLKHKVHKVKLVFQKVHKDNKIRRVSTFSLWMLVFP